MAGVCCVVSTLIVGIRTPPGSPLVYITCTSSQKYGSQMWLGEHCVWIRYFGGYSPILTPPQGSQPLWKSGKTLKMSFQFSSQGKLREFGENAKNQGKLREFVTVTQTGKVFASLGYVRLVPCVQVVFID